MAENLRIKSNNFLVSCDVIICAGLSTPVLRDSIESILRQIDALPFLHLIDTGSAGAVFDEYRGQWNVRCYRLPAGTTFFAGLHSIIESLRTPFVACQPAAGLSKPQRLAETVGALISEGAEIAATHCHGDSMIATATGSHGNYSRRINPSTLVIRRATFVDMGGIAEGFPDDDVEFLYRATCERRKIIFSDVPLIKLVVPEILPAVGQSPHYNLLRFDSLRDMAKGFPHISSAFDVVLPFHGHLDYVDGSLRGLLDQHDAELVIHLVDDASPEDTTSFMRRWSQQPNIRTYRNQINIGQFQSFNSVSRFFETELAAVQDADDVSLPHRFDWTGQVLHYSGADFFGGGVEMFGTEPVFNPHTHKRELPASLEQAPVRHSFYPHQSRDDDFVENPTTAFRVSMFRNMGGYADFGDRTANQTSVEMEFHERCRFHGVRFALSREIVVRYRVHQDSATRNPFTGRGTSARTISDQQQIERRRFYRRGNFDPKPFGSLDQIPQSTQRL